MNSAVGPRKRCAPERFFHNTAIAVAALLSCAPLAWSQTPADKATTSTAAPAAAQPKKPAKAAAPGGASDVKTPTNAKAQASYSLGVSMGDQLHHLGLTGDSIATERLTQGLRDSLSGKVAMTASSIAQPTVGSRTTKAKLSCSERSGLTWGRPSR